MNINDNSTTKQREEAFVYGNQMSELESASTRERLGENNSTIHIKREGGDRNLKELGDNVGPNYDNNNAVDTSHQFNPRASLLLSPAKNENQKTDRSKSIKKSAMSTSNINNNNEIPEGRMRLFISLLGLTIAAVNCYSQAAFCMAIVEMVIPTDYNPIPANQTPLSDPNKSQIIINEQQQQVKHHEQSIDGSCPILPDYRYFYDDWRFPLEPSSDLRASDHTHSSSQPITVSDNRIDSNSTSIMEQNSTNNKYLQQPILNIDNRFGWDASQQGFLLAAAAFGMAPLQIIGGRLAEVYGPKWVLLASCAGTAITNLTIPIMAHWGFMLLLLNRFLMGMSQGGMEPGVMCLLANWLPPSEVGFYISMLLFAMCIGGFFGSLLSSSLLSTSYGWPMTHYASGVLNLIAAIIWYQFASNKPRESAYITKEELNFIERSQGKPIEGCEARGKDHGEHEHSENEPNSHNKIPYKITIDLNSNIVNDDDHDDNNEDDNNHNIGRTKTTHDLIGCIKTNQPVITTPRLSKRSSSSISTKSSALVEPTNVTKNTTLSPNLDNDSGRDNQNESQHGDATPWKAILKTPAVWAFIICKVSVRWTADTLALMLPTYLANVLHSSIKLNGYINGLSTALFALSSFLAAYAFSEISRINYEDDEENAKTERRLSKTNLRKIAQSFASFGSAIAIFLMSKYACNLSFSMSMLLVVSFCLVMGTGGELQIPYDMTAVYPGTLHGMACTLSVSGWLAPSLIGLILGDRPNSRYRWSLVWYMTATINFIGGLVFVLFADASPRNFHKTNEVAGNRSSQMNLASKNGARNQNTPHDDNNNPITHHDNGDRDHDEKHNFHEPFCETKFSTKTSRERDQTKPHDLTRDQLFDNDDIKFKIRQPDNCFIQSASYHSGLDSLPATSLPMFPYKTKTKTRDGDA